MCKPLIYSFIVVAFVGCGKKQPWQTKLQQPQISTTQFTEIVADAIRDTVPKVKVRVVEPLEILVKQKHGSSTCYLDNAWKECRDDPASRLDAVTRHLDALKAALRSFSRISDPNIDVVVPLIKDQLWLDETKKQGLEIYREQLAGDIFVVYAEDGPDQLAFIDEQKFKAFGVSATDLREKAISNLSERLPEVQRHGDGPLYMLVAGGTFEASLLLFSKVWEDQDLAVDGRVVVAVPSRDLLLFTGENAHEAVQQMRSKVDDIHAGGNYLISKTILVRDREEWVPLVEE